MRLRRNGGQMSNKQMVLEAIRKLPEEASLDETSEEIALLAATQRGKDAAGSGRVPTRDEVKARSESTLFESTSRLTEELLAAWGAKYAPPQSWFEQAEEDLFS